MTGQWEHFVHDADIGVRGYGRTKNEAFASAALALTAVITEPDRVAASDIILIHCSAPDDELLLVDWLNALIFEMATRNMLFSRFEVDIKDSILNAHCWGEHLDQKRHQPSVEIKGATYTELSVRQDGEQWVAQTVVDV